MNRLFLVPPLPCLLNLRIRREFGSAFLRSAQHLPRVLVAFTFSFFDLFFELPFCNFETTLYSFPFAFTIHTPAYYRYICLLFFVCVNKIVTRISSCVVIMCISLMWNENVLFIKSLIPPNGVYLFVWLLDEISLLNLLLVFWHQVVAVCFNSRFSALCYRCLVTIVIGLNCVTR